MRGFSLVEVVIGLGISAAVIYSGTIFMQSHFEVHEKLNEKRDADIKSVHHKFFSKKFNALLDNAGISVHYFKLPITLSESAAHCGESHGGGCFMTLNEKGIRGSIFDGGDSSRGPLVKRGNKSSVNFFSDEALPRQLKSLDKARDEKRSIVLMKTVQYQKNVRKSAGKRYMVGWALKNPASPPFTVMTRIKNSFYLQMHEANAILPTSQDYSESDKEKLRSHFFVNAYNFGSDASYGEHVEDHSGMFYLYYASNIPQIYGVIYIKSIIKCKSESGGKEAVNPECENFYKLLMNEKDGFNLEDAENIDKKSQVLSYYLAQSSNPTDKITSFFPQKNDLKGMDLSSGLWVLQEAKGHPYFPYRTASLVAVDDDGNPTAIEGVSEQPISIASLMADFHTDRDTAVRIMGVSMVPITFYKFFLQTSGDDKDLVMISDVSERKGKSPRVVIRSLLDEARVVFARQLGTLRVSAFIFDDQEKESQEEVEH